MSANQAGKGSRPRPKVWSKWDAFFERRDAARKAAEAEKQRLDAKPDPK